MNNLTTTVKKQRIRVKVYRRNEYTTQYRYYGFIEGIRFYIGMCETFLDRKTWYAA